MRFSQRDVWPDYRGNAEKYLSLSAELGCRDSFDYIGPLYDEAKYDAIVAGMIAASRRNVEAIKRGAASRRAQLTRKTAEIGMVEG